MGRVNKTISGVFVDIVGTSKEISQYRQFINHGGEVNQIPEVKSFLDMYTSLVETNKINFEKLASLEEIIMQMRIKEDLNDIKLSLVRNYIYARTPFFRKSNSAKDIRVIVSKIEFHPESEGKLENLFGDKGFMNKAKRKLQEAMDVEIKNNILDLKKIH
jgi:hypothetical protein